MKKYLIPITTLCIGLALGYIVNSSKTTVEIDTEKLYAKEKAKKQTTKIIEENIVVLPIYIKNTLHDFKIDPNNLTKQKWNTFIAQLEEKSFDKFSDLLPASSLMHLAALKGSKRIIEKLLSQGYDINEKNKYGILPIILAINKNTSIDFLEFMIKNGADLDIYKDEKKRGDVLNTALGFNFNGKITTNNEIVEYLLKNGFSFKDKHFIQILHNDKYLKDYLEKTDINKINESYGNTHLKILLSNPVSKKTIDYILNSKIDLKNYSDSFSLTKDLIQSKYSTAQQIDYILSQTELDINKQGDFGETLLVSAVSTGNIDKIQLLLENGADPLILNNYKRNAYTYLKNNPRLNKNKKQQIRNLLNSYID